MDPTSDIFGPGGGLLRPPVIACVPVDPSTYPRDVYRAWKTTEAEVGRTCVIRPGSTRDVCGSCGVAVWVGPHQDAIRGLAAAQGLRDIVVCMVCAAVMTRDADTELVVLGDD